MNQASFTILDCENYLFIDLNGLKTLVNTGYNQSLGNQGLALLDKKFSLDIEFMGVSLENISKFSQTEIDLVLGADILNEFVISIDCQNQNMIISQDPFDFQGDEFTIEIFMNVPIISIELNNTPIDAFFDTSASLSYVTSNYVTGFESKGEETDFYPTVGQFTTKKYLIPSSISNYDFNLSVGTLPLTLQRMRNIHGNKGIIGVELLKHFAVYLDYRSSIIKLRSIGR